MSDFSRHGMAPPAPITPFSATATMRTISITASPPCASAVSAGPPIRQTVHSSIRTRAERFIEFDRRRVPVQHGPLQTRPAVSDAFLCQMNQQRLADTLAAQRRTDEQVFEIDSGTAAEGGKIDEPDREAGRLAVPLGDLAKQRGLPPNSAASMSASVASTSWSSFSYSASSRTKDSTSPASPGARAADGERHQSLTPLLIQRPRP